MDDIERRGDEAELSGIDQIDLHVMIVSLIGTSIRLRFHEFILLDDITQLRR